MSIAIVKENHTLGATLLVTGCCIGAGMIGLPVVSAVTGFIPSTLAMILCYFFATGTGLLILEATLWFEEKVNLISMANYALGIVGKAITWTLFLFLFYCLFVAYIDGGGQLFANMLSSLSGYQVPREVGILSCVSFVAAIVYTGTRGVSYITRLFLAGLAFSYCSLLTLGMPHIKGEQLLHTNWNAALSTLPILLICFGYQNLVPTLTYYVKKNVNTLRFAIFVGNLIPMLIYLLWNYVILGILPDANSTEFAKATNQSQMVTQLLEKASESESVLFFAKSFSLFAVLTPFIANTLTFVHFLKDGLRFSKTLSKDFFIYLMVLIPPTLLTLIYPDLFLKALGIAGGFADVILFGIMPALIVWIGRYVKKVNGPYTVSGGKSFLIMIFLLSVGILLIRG